MQTEKPFSVRNLSFNAPIHFPLWLVLITPFIIIIIFVVGLTNYLAYKNSQQVVDDIANQLLYETNARIAAEIGSFLAIPERINRNNARVFTNGLVDVTDIEAMGQFFWNEVQLYESVTSIYFGNPDGGLVSGGREGADGSFYVMTSDNFASGELNKYATDENGNSTEILVTVPQFDSRVRPWYTGAIDTNGTNWTSPYVLSTGQDLAIASSLPVYDNNGDLLGIVSVDIFLSHIRSFLSDLEIGDTGQAFITEHSGLLVTTSDDSASFIRSEDNRTERILAIESDNAIINAIAQQIVATGNGLESEEQQSFSVTIDGQAYYVLVSPFHTGTGIDWDIVLVIPEADFLSSIEDHTRVTISLTLIAVAIAIIAGTILTFLILRPISRLSVAAQNLAQGNWLNPVPISGVWEMKLLAAVFNTMSSQLQELFSNLEERIAERTEALSVSEARYRGIVEDQTELICRSTPDYHVRFYNGAYGRYFAKTEEEIIGHSFMPHVLDADTAMLQSKLGSLSKENPLVPAEHQVIRGDGQTRWLQWMNRGIFDDAGELTEIQSVGRDITEAKQFEARLQQALDREIELNHLKTQFITTVSHEFRTPMAIIMNSVEILERYSERLDDEQKEKHYEKAKAQIARMTKLLEDVLTIGRNNSGQVQLECVDVEFKALMESIIDESKIGNKGIVQIEFTSSGECGERSIDVRLLRLIISNLIGNATKYSKPDSTVLVNLDCQPDLIEFSVQDEGIGIPAANQADIFQPFYRADNSANITGTGLGLAIAKRSVEQHGGTIEFVSKEGKGTTFTVSIPAQIASKEGTS